MKNIENTTVTVNAKYDDRVGELLSIFEDEQKTMETFGKILNEDSTIAELMGAILGILYGASPEDLAKRISDFEDMDDVGKLLGSIFTGFYESGCVTVTEPENESVS